MHIVVPLDCSARFDRVHTVARQVATVAATKYPDELTIEQRKDRRGGRVFLDYMRNSPAQTAVSPYSVRPLEGAPVATPLTWSEALARNMTAQKYNLKTVLRRVSKKGDPWSEISHNQHSLAAARKDLEAQL
jgi:bifunctional non-homologous end joining protein LigD